MIPATRHLTPSVLRLRWFALLRAALRYVAVADWFESRSMTGPPARELEAWRAFAEVEHELRAAGQIFFRGGAARRDRIVRKILHDQRAHIVDETEDTQPQEVTTNGEAP